MLIDFKDEDFDNKIKNEAISIFQYSASWCSPCKGVRVIMEKLSDSVNNAVNNTLVENFLRNIKGINEKIETIDSSITTLRNDTLSNFSQQMSDFKKEYMENLRLNLTSNVSDKIEPFVKEQMQLLLERTSTIFNETLPKNVGCYFCFGLNCSNSCTSF